MVNNFVFEYVYCELQWDLSKVQWDNGAHGSVEDTFLAICVCTIPCFPIHAGVSDLQPTGHMWLRMAMNVAQHKIINLLKTL